MSMPGSLEWTLAKVAEVEADAAWLDELDARPSYSDCPECSTHLGTPCMWAEAIYPQPDNREETNT